MDVLLEWGFVAIGLLAVAGFMAFSIRHQRNIEAMQQPPDDLRSPADEPPGVDGTTGFL
jgi:hypothetical protein